MIACFVIGKIIFLYKQINNLKFKIEKQKWRKEIEMQKIQHQKNKEINCINFESELALTKQKLLHENRVLDYETKLKIREEKNLELGKKNTMLESILEEDLKKNVLIEEYGINVKQTIMSYIKNFV